MGMHSYTEKCESAKTDDDTQVSECCDLLNAALNLYEPPFTFHCGYIHDSKGRMFSDDDSVPEGIISRVRGWGRLGYLRDGPFKPEQLQDQVGEIIAMALNEFWEKHKGI